MMLMRHKRRLQQSAVLTEYIFLRRSISEHLGRYAYLPCLLSFCSLCFFVTSPILNVLKRHSDLSQQILIYLDGVSRLLLAHLASDQCLLSHLNESRLEHGFDDLQRRFLPCDHTRDTVVMLQSRLLLRLQLRLESQLTAPLEDKLRGLLHLLLRLLQVIDFPSHGRLSCCLS